MENQQEIATSGTLTAASSVPGFLDYLKNLDTTSVMDPTTQKRITEAIADLPPEHQIEAKEAFLGSAKAVTASLDQTIVALSKMMTSDENAQKIEGKCMVRALFPATHAAKSSYKTQAQKHEDNLHLIEKNWGQELSACYRNLGLTQSASSWVSIMSSKIDSTTAAVYLNAEILDRMEKKSRTCKGNVPEGHCITGNDALRAKEKALAAKAALANPKDIMPMPILDGLLIDKHNLRFSKKTGLLKPRREEDSEHGVNDENQNEVMPTQSELINSFHGLHRFNEAPFGYQPVNSNVPNLSDTPYDHHAGNLNAPNFFDETSMNYHPGNVGSQGYYNNVHVGYQAENFENRAYFNNTGAESAATVHPKRALQESETTEGPSEIARGKRSCLASVGEERVATPDEWDYLRARLLEELQD